MKAIDVEILSMVPVTYRHCPSCEMLYGRSGIGDQVHQEILNEYPVEFLQERDRLSQWVDVLIRQYRPHIRVRVIDPQSALGLWKSLRHWVRRYPAFIVNHREKVTGWDEEALDRAIQRVHDAAAT
jgi:hypothetical protein